MNPGLTSLLTVISGVIVFVLGQLAQRFILEPLQEQRKTIGDIAFNLVYLANLTHVKDLAEKGYPIKHQMDPHNASALLRRLAQGQSFNDT